MKIQDQDLYHGAALTQIVEHKSFKALNRASEKYGHYLVNTDKHVFVKYRTVNRSPWTFTVQPDELAVIKAEIDQNYEVFLCLVCGGKTVCALNSEEINNVINSSSNSSQWIRVEVPKGGSCHVNGSVGNLKLSVPHNSFPEKVFI